MTLDETDEPSLVDVLSLVCRVGFGRVWCMVYHINEKERKEGQIERERKNARK